MDYEQLYKEAKQRAIDASIDGFLDAVAVEEIFPELAESEDEKIRKAIIGYIDHGQHYGVSNKDMIAWLEKQETSYTKRDVDDAYIKGIAFAKNELEKQNKQILANSAKTCKDEQKLSNLESNGEKWSEKDEEFLRRAINAAKDAYPMTAKWLKSLKDRLKGE